MLASTDTLSKFAVRVSISERILKLLHNKRTSSMPMQLVNVSLYVNAGICVLRKIHTRIQVVDKHVVYV